MIYDSTKNRLTKSLFFCTAIMTSAFAENATTTTVESQYSANSHVERSALINAFSSQYSVPVSEVKRISSKLIELLDKSVERRFKIDLYISDEIDNELYSFAGGDLNSEASYEFNLITHESTYKLNGIPSTQGEIGQIREEDIQKMSEKRALLDNKRRENIKKIAALIKPDDGFELAISDAATHLTITLSRGRLLALLKSAEGTISDYDIHTDLHFSADTSQTLSEWLNVRDGYLQGISLTQMHGEWNSIFPNTRGKNIGIYYSDGKCLDWIRDPFDGSSLLYREYTVTGGSYKHVGSGTGNPERKSHTKIITGIFGTVANQVNLYCDNSDLGNNDNDYYTSILPTSSKIPGGMSNINIESYSLNKDESNDDNAYNAMDATFDHHQFLNRTIPIFISAGNTTNDNVDDNASNDKRYPGNVVSPAKAFNAVTVGSYGRAGVGSQVYSDFSSYLDPTVGGAPISKPEVSAPGEKFHYEHYNLDGFFSNGTSFATPWTAAMASDVMSRGNFWQNSAAMIKAIVIAGSTDPVTLPAILSSGNVHDRVGEGGVDLIGMTGQLSNVAYWYNSNPDGPFVGTNESKFDYGDACFTNWQTDLIGGRQQRIVIAWLNDVTNASGLSHIPNEYTMELLNSNEVSVSGGPIHIQNQGYQIFNTSQPSGTYTVRVCKTNRHDGKRFDMGFAVSQRLESSIWDQ